MWRKMRSRRHLAGNKVTAQRRKMEEEQSPSTRKDHSATDYPFTAQKTDLSLIQCDRSIRTQISVLMSSDSGYL